MSWDKFVENASYHVGVCLDWMEANAETLTSIVIVLAVLVFIGILVFQPTQPHIIEGVLLDRQYETSRTSTGFGTSADGKPVTTTSYEGERWVFILRTSEGIATYSVSPRIYYSEQYQLNERIQLPCARGEWIHIISCEE